MKRIKFFALALFIASFCLVSCNDENEKPINNDQGTGTDQPGDQGDPSDPDYIDLSTVNFMKYAWWVTELECAEIPEATMTELQKGIREHTLQFDNFGISNAVDYKGWCMNLSIHVQSRYSFVVEYYKMQNKKHLVSFKAGNVLYTGEIIMTQDKNNIYATFTAKASAKGTHQVKFACYLPKK